MSFSVIFFGSSAYSLIILEKLLTLPDFSVSAVVTKPDKPFGRNQKITPNPVAVFAQKHNLTLLQPIEFDPQFKLNIRNLSLDIGLCVAYGPPFFDQEMIDLPKYKIVNIHPSPLPKYRGATPGPWQIINGQTASAVTFFQIDPLPDHGPIISQIPFTISPIETSESFYKKAFSVAADHLQSVIINYLHHPNDLSPQNHLKKSYFPRFTKESAKINWGDNPAKIGRFVRAMQPWPIAWTEVKNQNNEILKMKILSFNTEPVEVLIEGKKPALWSQIKKHYQIIN